MIDRTISEDLRRVVGDLSTGQATLSLRGKHALVTGGAGFLGSYLCDVLLQLGASVTCLDNLSTGITRNVDHLFALRDSFRLVKSDVADFSDDEDYDYILHFAGRPSPEEYQLHPVETLITSSGGTHIMLELARRHDSRILLASSSEVYGDSTLVPTPETYWGNVNPVGIRSCYDEGKRFAESLLMAYHREYGLETRIVRIFNTYGPRLRADGPYARALSRFVMQALKGEDLTVYGDGSQTRSFCYVTDTITGVIKTILKEGLNGDVFNIGNPRETTILDLAKTIQRIVGTGSRITFHSLPQDDPRRRRPDISKAKSLLDWHPRVTLEEGLERTNHWFRVHLTT